MHLIRVDNPTDSFATLHKLIGQILCNNKNIAFTFSVSCSAGSCEHGTFPCGPIDDNRCVPQHLICSRSDACREDYRALCGLNYGSTDFIESIVNSSTDDINFCCKCSRSQLQCRDTALEFTVLIFPSYSTATISRGLLLLAWHRLAVWCVEFNANTAAAARGTRIISTSNYMRRNQVVYIHSLIHLCVSGDDAVSRRE